MTVYRLLVLVTIAAMAALVGPPAGAQTQPDLAVYASQAGGDWQGTRALLIGATEVLELYIDKRGTGSSTTKCDTEEGNGDELCGYDAVIEVQGDAGAFISDFDPDSSLASEMAFYPDTPLPAGTRQLRVNLVDVNPPDANPIHIGTLSVDATAARGPVTVLVTGQGAVLANLDLVPIPVQIIAVPEPAELLLLGIGIPGLAGLHRLRRWSRRAARPAC
jgi:hypothetical protein